MSSLRVALNVLAFQAAWLGGVAGAGRGRLWLGPAIALAAAAAHLALAAAPRRELRGLVAVSSIGCVWDVVPAALGLIDYRGGIAALGGLPLWMGGLWLAFATTLNCSLRWLRGRVAVAIALGAAAGPLTFAAAERFAALTLVEPAGALAVQAAGWAVLLPLASMLAARSDGTRGAAPEPRHV